ncbi:MAG: hypothetical protein KJ061_03350 [Vicinamibacteraceae bacterium]|nr:hypothetical protein [Vicinamibacteraceae bacterium]
MVRSPRARFDLAARLRTPGGAPLGEVFSFVSGLYFRGKLAYARAFARPPEGAALDGGVYVITPSAGLRTPDTHVTVEALDAFAAVDVAADNPRYRAPLERAARALDAEAGPGCEVVLLGSIATPKYVDVLVDVFGERLVFPSAFVGRGDMSRGGLLLRAVEAGEELAYAPVAGAVRRGPRPPKLTPRPPKLAPG